MRREVAFAAVGLMVVSALSLGLPISSASQVDGEFPDRVFTITKDVGPKGEITYASMFKAPYDCVWWLELVETEGSSVAISVFERSVTTPHLIDSSELTQVGEESTHVSLLENVKYVVEFTYYGMMGGSAVLMEHAIEVGINNAPEASFAVFPASGDVDTVFTFDASGSSDVEDPTSALEVRWDWELDDVWDTEWSTNKTAAHQFHAAGDYCVALEVRDSGLLTDKAFRNLTVTPSGISRSVEYLWYDMFGHPIGEHYDYRMDLYGDEWRVTDTYPYLYAWAGAPPGNTKIYTFSRLNITGRDMPEMSMNSNPEFLPYLGEERGGTAKLDWCMYYPTFDEADEKLPEGAVAWYDGWMVDLMGTVTLDEQAAKAVLGVSDQGFDDFAAWWTANGVDVKNDWEAWMINEASNDRLAIYNAYEYDLQFMLFEMDAEKVGAEIVVTFDTISWGAEALMFRWLREAFMPTEWYMEDMHLHATIGSEMTDINLDAAVQYALYAYESLEDGSPCWVWEAMLQDFVESSLIYPYSEFDPYASLDHLNRAPGSDWYGEMMPYDHTPGAWNLSENEKITFEWPEGEVLFFAHQPGNSTGLIEDTAEVWSAITVEYAEPLPSDTDKIIIDEGARRISLIGPFDAWTWSKEQETHERLADEWDRLGILPQGVPHIEFRAVTAPVVNTPPVADLWVYPQTGTIDTVFAFDASGSWDAEDSDENLSVRWDWETDGVWDTPYLLDKTAEHQFLSRGVYAVSVQVIDSGGLTDGTTRSVEVVGDEIWGIPTLIESDDTGNAWSPTIDVDYYGNAIAVWYQFDGAYNSIMANRFAVDSGWGEAVAIEMNEMSACFPQIDMDPSGNAVVVWSQHADGQTSVWAVQYDVDSGWGSPELLRSEYSSSESIPQCSVASNGLGDTVAVWSQHDGLYSSIWSCRLDKDSGWSDPELLEFSNLGNAWSPEIAADYGNWTVVWHQWGDGQESIWAVRYEASTGWSLPQEIDDVGPWSAHNPVVAADMHGHAICAWEQAESGWSSIFASRYVPGLGWSSPELIEHNDAGDAVDPQISMEPRGDASVVWRQLNGHEVEDAIGDIAANLYKIGSGWGTEVYIYADSAMDAWEPKVAMCYDNVGPVVMWMRSDGVRQTIWSSWYVEIDGWCDPVLIGMDDSWYAFPSDIAVTRGGDAFAMWHQYSSGVWNVWANRYELPPAEPPSDASLTYRVYDMFEEPYHEWWDRRFDNYGRELFLTSDDGNVTMLYYPFGVPTGDPSDYDQTMIYAPYRWNIVGEMLPNANVHEPEFMPVLGTGPVTGAEASVHIYFNYLTAEWWNDYWVAEWSSHPDWIRISTQYAQDDGYILGTYMNVSMNRLAAEEWIGLDRNEVDVDGWWTTNRAAYEADWEAFMISEANDRLDIWCGYYDKYWFNGVIIELYEAGPDEVYMEIAHFSWGYEALMTRWLNETGISTHQPWFEDFEMVVDYRDDNIDVEMDAVCQWAMHCNKQNESGLATGAPCAWVWEPLKLDYVPSSHSPAGKSPSEYDPYEFLTYQGWNCGDCRYGATDPFYYDRYECAPNSFSLPDYGRLVFELPQRDDVIGYYGEAVTSEAPIYAWMWYAEIGGNIDEYIALQHRGSVELGWHNLGAADYSYDGGANVLTINGPFDWYDWRDEGEGILWHGAPWIEFNVVEPTVAAAAPPVEDCDEIESQIQSSTPISTGSLTASGFAAPLTIAIATLVALTAVVARLWCQRLRPQISGRQSPSATIDARGSAWQ